MLNTNSLVKTVSTPREQELIRNNFVGSQQEDFLKAKESVRDSFRKFLKQEDLIMLNKRDEKVLRNEKPLSISSKEEEKEEEDKILKSKDDSISSLNSNPIQENKSSIEELKKEAVNLLSDAEKTPTKEEFQNYVKNDATLQALAENNNQIHDNLAAVAEVSRQTLTYIDGIFSSHYTGPIMTAVMVAATMGGAGAFVVPVRIARSALGGLSSLIYSNSGQALEAATPIAVEHVSKVVTDVTVFVLSP
jgi:hypothetical protein